MADNTLHTDKSKSLGSIPEGFVYRDQRKRYPWWVKSRDRIAVETDASSIEKPTTNLMEMSVMYRMSDPDAPSQRKNMIKRIKNKTPGYSLPDVSLLFASQSFWQAGVDIDGLSIQGYQELRKIIDDQLHTPEELGVEKWKGTELEASAMVEKAAIHLGAAQVGFTAMDLTWLGPNVSISPDVDEPVAGGDGVKFPPSYKYMIIVAGRVPMWAAKCAPSSLGSAADRTGYEEAHTIEEKLINFIKGIGYGACDIHLMGINPVPFAVMAGLGEMGRMNRVVSPLFGGAIRFSIILTDLPLALDKPIDFGLQEFCRHCKKCAKACPANAISFDTDPFWEPLGPYSFKGKKVWYEDCGKCGAYIAANGSYCGACLASCVWNKGNKTALHTIAKVMGAKMPSASGFLAFMDDLFGYGLVSEENRKKWWDLDLTVRGVGSSVEF